MNKLLLSFSLFFIVVGISNANANIDAHSGEQLSSENAPVAGPWDSEDGKLSFIQIRGRFSWWSAQRECWFNGYELPTWDEISNDYRFLNGTTPVMHNAYKDWNCPVACPLNFWTGLESSDNKKAFLFETASPLSMDPRPLYKDHLSSVLCVRVN